MACRMSRPDCTSRSSALSSLAESLPWGAMTGASTAFSSPHASASHRSASRARIHVRLPWSVLISPLWHSIRKGCARSQVGNVFVLYRWWNTAMAV